ncbi:hypothetical protein P3T76_010377 [Phytophthora citrophthora]|uniref:Uncharacterized protein n=1 Tax=Phytophthora citrophthora TaxID=4793 RepID=A0AAD9GC92_9STRA|nr:hypothetical protein P3T76_010377 [Phytophthora citrophthora]
MNKGEVNFLFGVELKEHDSVNAESELKSKLTELGLFRPVSNGGGLTSETFIFHEESLPMIHELVCGIRYAYHPPKMRKTPTT